MSNALDQVTDIKKLTLDEGDVLLIRINRGDLPENMWEEYAQKVRNTMTTLLLTTRIVIYSDEMEFSIITENKLKELANV